MGGYRCTVTNCKNVTGTKGISFFRFSKDLKRAELWLKFCNKCIEKPLEQLHNNYRMCSEHFISSMFLNNLKNRLQPHAIPTINLSRNLESLSENKIQDNVTVLIEKNIEENIIKTVNESSIAVLPEKNRTENIIEPNILETHYYLETEIININTGNKKR
ncbi:52 kDa repressor of the inhibitor of the protein kinase-like [Anoplolepis gracilipes]|uniref:52 kDa repressor of the inhibitor of the protein kinase-like n=1 Tax=Anoplolepis gracilipes TaxID=354296 RepID=UPI003B9FE917